MSGRAGAAQTPREIEAEEESRPAGAGGPTEVDCSRPRLSRSVVVLADVLLNLGQHSLMRSLFWSEGEEGLRAPFAGRGIASGADAFELEIADYEPVGCRSLERTWVLFDELRDLDWTEEAPSPGGPWDFIEVGGEAVFLGASSAQSPLRRSGHQVFSRPTLTRGDFLGGSNYQTLFETMQALAARASGEDVRWSVGWYIDEGAGWGSEVADARR